MRRAVKHHFGQNSFASFLFKVWQRGRVPETARISFTPDFTSLERSTLKTRFSSPIWLRKLGNVGAILRGLPPNGQKLAGKPIGNNAQLASQIVTGKFDGPCGSTLPAPHMHLLFRTPSFSGQVCDLHNDLLAFFLQHYLLFKWQLVAQCRFLGRFLLPLVDGSMQLLRELSKEEKGQNSCKSTNSYLRFRRVQGCWHAEKRRKSRHYLVAAPERLALWLLVPIRSLVPRPGQQPIFCTASLKTTVTDTRISGASKTPTVIARYAVAGQFPRGGVLRSKNTKTKDVPCSIRS